MNQENEFTSEGSNSLIILYEEYAHVLELS